MSRRIITLLLICAAILVGCQNNEPRASTPTTIFPTATLRPTATPRPNTPTPIQTLSPTLTATKTRIPPTETTTNTSTPFLLPNTSLITDCVDVAESLPPEVVLDGSLVLFKHGVDHSMSWLDLASGVLSPISLRGDIAVRLTISPNGRWLGYIDATRNHEHWYTVTSLHGQPISITPMENWVMILGWLDNERLIILQESQEGNLDSLVMLNPFTGQYVELQPNFPDIDYMNLSTKWSPARAVYDPSLTRVVYPELAGGDIALWDIPNNQPLAEVPGCVGCGALPVWSPDGEYVSIVGMSTVSIPNGWYQELYLVSREGEVTQATNLSDYYPDELYTYVLIDKMSWSPDSRYIGYWLWTPPNGQEYSFSYPIQLVVLDTSTMQSTNYCIPGPPNANEVGPFWSPDGEWMAVKSQCGASKEDCVVLVNIGEKYAVRIIDGWEVAGWMIGQ